jgi:hypothetical protein
LAGAPEGFYPAYPHTLKELVSAADSLSDAEEITNEQRREVDLVDDRVEGGTYAILTYVVRSFEQTIVPLNPHQQEQLDAARYLLATHYSDAVAHLHFKRPAQWGVTKLFLEQVSHPRSRKAFKTLALDTHIDLTTAIHQEYGRRMGYSTADDLPTALELWHQALEGYLGAVIANHKAGALRDRLTQPYETIAAQLHQTAPSRSSKNEDRMRANPKDAGTPPLPEEIN